jgi:hypothetical protein
MNVTIGSLPVASSDLEQGTRKAITPATGGCRTKALRHGSGSSSGPAGSGDPRPQPANTEYPFKMPKDTPKNRDCR